MSEGGGRTILILEDDEGVARLERLRLERAGYSAVVVDSPSVALARLAEGGIDLLILDYQLREGVNGLEFHRQFREAGLDVPSILVTGFSDEAMLAEAIRAGIRDFLPKTTDYLDFLPAAVTRVLKQVQTERQLAASEAQLAAIAERQRAEESLREAREHLQRVVESVRDYAIFSTDVDGRIVSWNPGAERIFGYAEGEILGRDAAVLFTPEDRAAGLHGRELENAAARGYSEDERFHLRKDGSRFYASGMVTPLHDHEGKLRGFTKVARDVTDRKQAEVALRNAKAAAEEANRAKDQFLAVLSHELRTPLNPILLAVSATLDRSHPDDEIRPLLEMIRENVSLEARLIDDLLDITRISRGKMPLEWGIVDGHALIRRSLEICQGDVEAKGLRVALALDAVRHLVNADSARLQQVFWNLIKNAVKFTPEGGAIAIRTRDESDPGGSGDVLVVEIVDTGIGIEPAMLARIFDPFQQGESSITRRFGGMGLGLAISRGVVEAHGGLLTVASEGKDRGATFRVFLRALPDSEADLHRNQAPAPAPPIEAPSGRQRLLLVEDEPATLRLMDRLLRGLGCEVISASTIQQAIQIVDVEEFDLVVSDIGLPDGTGLDLMRRIRDRRPTPGIALTGYGMEDDIRRSREAGFSAHLTKPIDFRRLEELIRQVLDPARRTASATGDRPDPGPR